MASVNLAPLLHLLLLAALMALVPLGWLAWRHRCGQGRAWWRGLTWMALFLTLDLVLVGAFTRLTDSGLGCPDWPGCYGTASPWAAQAPISAAAQAQPGGPVTPTKAWIEMAHRYLAATLGAVILVLCLTAWIQARRATPGPSPAWASLSLAWVCLQGAFGALTVTLKLYPAIVTLHLWGGLLLVALLAVQALAFDVPQPLRRTSALSIAYGLAVGLTLLQITLGAWVSSNYAVLACSDFPTCQGQWWPSMDLRQGFTILRPLGLDAAGQPLPFAALTGIHFMHRLGALLLLSALGALAWALLASGTPAARRFAQGLLALAAWQLLSGLANVVLQWPLAAALTHTGGAALLVLLLAVLGLRLHQARSGACAGQASITPSGRFESAS